MHRIFALLSRFGLFAHKQAHVDPRYDQRLMRICMRETHRKGPAGTAPRG